MLFPERSYAIHTEFGSENESPNDIIEEYIEKWRILKDVREAPHFDQWNCF